MGGDIDERLDEFDKACIKLKETSGDDIPEELKIGIICNRLPDSPLKTHLQLRLASFATYASFRKEIVDVTRVQQAPEDMDVGVELLVKVGTWML